MSIYRNIWEEAHGPIPFDEDGRTYEIHHIDGDRNNNSLDNLLCCSIKEHFDIHYDQGDYGACMAIAFRMAHTSKELSDLQSKLSSASNIKRIEEGTHNFLDLEWRKKHFNNRSSERVSNGTHNFLNGDIQHKTTRRRVEQGSFNFNSDYAKHRELEKRLKNGPIIEEIKRLKEEKGVKLEKNWHHRGYETLCKIRNTLL